MNKPARIPICVVVGVGPGNGEAFVRRFVKAGYIVAMLARRIELTNRLATELTNARPYACDVTSEESVRQTFATIKAELGVIDTIVFNAGSGVWGNIETLSVIDFESAWRVNALGLFMVAKQVVPDMKENGCGNIVVIGATASRRGVAGTAAFAPAKGAQRLLTESLARHLWPSGIHVSLVVVDGKIASPELSLRASGQNADAFIDPNSIAETVLQLVRQQKSAWSFEVEARPFNEKW